MRALVRVSPCAIAAALVVMAASSDAYADCADVNSGAFNRTAYTPPGSGVLNTSTGFAVGDTLTFTVSGLPGSSFELINGALNTALLIQPLSGTPATVSYTVTGSNDDTTLNTYMLVQAIPYEITIAATCVAAGGGGATVTGQDVAHAFIASRMSALLLDDASATSLANRSGATQPHVSAGNGAGDAANATALFGGATGLRAGLGDDDAVPGAASLHFAQSLSQLRREAAETKTPLALGAGAGGPAAFPEAISPWEVWVEGRYSTFDDSLDRSGHFGVLYFGGDYRIVENMIVGVLTQVDWAKDDSGALGSRVEGTGWMIGPYMSARVHGNVYLDLRAAWGRSSNDLALAGATGDFDTDRWLLKGTLSGNWTHAAWRITPSAELAYMTESAESFTDSAGTFVPGQDVSLGRLQFGPEIGYRFNPSPAVVFEPFAAIKGVWDFDNPTLAIVDGIGGRGDVWGRLQGGLNVVTARGLTVRGLASWDGLGADDYDGYTLKGSIHIPLN